ncbi:MAG: hypothetical protein WKF43_04265 [Acidimicrobiales bacterium]
MVVRATEGFTAGLPGLHRELAPIYSLMIVTVPLPPAFWEEVGWTGRETCNDGGHLIIYAQRTADDRIAFGGRGAPYHFGSRTEARFDRHDTCTGTSNGPCGRCSPAWAEPCSIIGGVDRSVPAGLVVLGGARPSHRAGLGR